MSVSYLDFITPDWVYDQGRDAVHKWKQEYVYLVNNHLFKQANDHKLPKPKLTTVWEGDSLDILARESIEGLTKHQPKGKSRYGNQSGR